MSMMTTTPDIDTEDSGNLCIVSPVNLVGAILAAQVDCWKCVCIKEYGKKQP